MQTPMISWAPSMNAWGKWVDKDLVETCYAPVAFKSLRLLMDRIPGKYEYLVRFGNTGANQDD